MGSSKSGGSNTNSNQQGGGSSTSTTTPGYAPGQENFINALSSLFGNAGQGSPWASAFQGITPDMANQMASESSRIAAARLPQFGLQDSGAGQLQVARVAGDTLRNSAQFNSSLMQSGFMGLGELLGSQLQGLQPVTTTGSYSNWLNSQSRTRSWENTFDWSKIIGSTAAVVAACYVASELFGGWYEPKTVSARWYILNEAPIWFRDFYIKYGKKIAEFLHKHTWLKPIVKPLFEYFASKGSKHGNN